MRRAVPRERLTVSGNEMAKHAIMSRRGISLTTMYTLSLELEAGALVKLDVERTPILRTKWRATPCGQRGGDDDSSVELMRADRKENALHGMRLGTAVAVLAAVLAVTGLALWYFFGPEPPTSPAADGDAVVTWEPPTEREDGTPLTALQGYRIYYGRDPGDLQETIEVGPEATEHRIENLEHGAWYFAVSAISADGLESEKSAAVEKVIGR